MRTNERTNDGTRRVDEEEEEEEDNNGWNGMTDEQGQGRGGLRTNERTSEPTN